MSVVVSNTSPQSTLAAAPTAAGTGGVARFGRALGNAIPMVLATAIAATVIVLGIATGWSLPRPSALEHSAPSEDENWCDEHSVPEALCVECNSTLLPKAKEHGWCRTHGVHECPLDHPDVAQLRTPPTVTPGDRERAARALAFAPRVENNSQCKLHQRRIQVESTEIIDRLGIGMAAASTRAVTEAVTAPGEIIYDPTRVIRMAPRASGTVWRVERRVGDRVAVGDILALIDSPVVGKAKAEFQQALVDRDLRGQVLAGLRASPGAVSGRSIQEAESAVDEADLRVLSAEQALLNLDLPIQAADVAGLAPAEIAARLRLLGLPSDLASQVSAQTGSSGLIAIRSPLDGEVIARSAMAGDITEPTKPLFVVADTRQMWLMLRVKAEDVEKVMPGQPVRFRHEAHTEGDAGTVAWVSPTADERSRAVSVRVVMPNADRRHHANTFGTARVVLREEPAAVVVPSEAVHWEGDCNIVFVRDKNFDKEGSPKVFHVRKVRPGATDVAANGPVTEVIVGLVPGEWVATANSGVFRSELLKNNLGAG